MKAFTKFLAAVLTVGFLSYSCQPEGVEPKASNNPAADGSEDHPPVEPICGPTWSGVIKDSTGSNFGRVRSPLPPFNFVNYPYGTIDVMNTDNSLVVQWSGGTGWYTANNAVFVGLLSDCPRRADGSLAPEQFPQQNSVNPVRRNWQQYIPIAPNTPACCDIVVWCRVGRLNLSGQLTNIRAVWAAGQWNSNLQAFTLNFCWTMDLCPLQGVDVTPECTTVLSGYPGTSCTTLTATEPTSGGVPPYTYTWTNDQNGETWTGQSINVCPTQTTTYTVSITDALSHSASASATVNVIYVGCTGGTNGNGNGNGGNGGNGNNNNPNHKVIVCHKPPGNPANVQTICIDWSGVPAHVERFRDPTMNPNMGHDSGCEIGPCGLANPCN